MTDLTTLANAQAFLQDTTSASQAWVQSCLDAASQAIIDYLGHDPTTQTRTEIIGGSNTAYLYPRASGKNAPISGITSISINPAMCAPGLNWLPWGIGLPNGITPIAVDITTLNFDDNCIFYTNGYTFPRGKKNLTVTFTSGYALTATNGIQTMPNSIVQATLYTTSAFFTALGKEMNATSESYSGVLSQGFFPTGAGAIPPAAKMLLNPYRTLMNAPA
jgi:hypothetical protein